MESFFEFIKNNKEWAFSGAGVSLIGFLTKRFFERKIKKPLEKTDTNGKININITNSNTLNNIPPKEGNSSQSNLNILFVDDNHTDFSMVSILKKSGYPLTKSIKDITDLNDIRVRESDIIFVDINGVGLKLFTDQGLGLASALKAKYPNKKIVIYSAESNGDRFHKALREVDGCLYKDAEPYQFITKIEELWYDKK